MEAHEIYEGAVHRKRRAGVFNRPVTVSKIDQTHVHWTDGHGSIGASPINSFADDVIERVYPNRPQVADVIEQMRRMEPEQRAEVLRAFG